MTTRLTARVEELVLRDGRTVLVRPVNGDDTDRLIYMHGLCSEDARHFRFHAPKPRLRRVEAEYLAAADGARRVALVATIADDGQERLVADARFEPVAPGDVDAAVLVRDDFTGCGLGSQLLGRLLDLAAGRGHRRLLLDVLPENRAMLALGTRFGATLIGSDGRALLFAVSCSPDRDASFERSTHDSSST